ncbi:MAG: hypothetical protein V3W19_08870 [Desulfatiglandales bacterium]
MKVQVQDTLKAPTDWRELDSRNWYLEPARPLPVSVGGQDNERGYFHKLCVQGMLLTGDHHSVKHLIDGCEVTSWSDDPEDEQTHPDWNPNDPKEWWFRAHVIRFRELSPNDELGGAITPHTTRVLYAGKRVLEEWMNNSPNGYQDMILKPWEEFVKPPLNLTRHGIWVSDELEVKHEEMLSPPNWRSWGEHLDPKELDREGLVKPQHAQGRMSPPKGTITYFLRDTDQASGVHVATSGLENEMNSTAGASETEASANYAPGVNRLEFLWTTLASNPNDADWPNGLYECQTDCSAIGLDMSYGLLTLGASDGHFANVDSGLTTDNETWTQDEGAFTAATLNMASNTIDPASGAASDRFEVLVAGARAAGCHGNQTFIMRYSSDAFGRGPWAAPDGEDEEWAGTLGFGQQEPVREKNEIVEY